MTTSEQNNGIPTEVWASAPGYSQLDEPVQRALYEMNQKNPDQLIDTLKASVEQSETGVTYAMLRGDNPGEYSDSEAIVAFNSFGNAATPNMLVRAEFIREVAKYNDVRGADGKLKPVVMLASPGLGGSKLRLTKEERCELKQGELGPVTRELLRAVSEKDIGQVSLLGFSQGADVALAGARSPYSANLDIQVVAVGDPAGVETRSTSKLASDFFKAGVGDLKKAVAATGLDAQKKALGSGAVDFACFGISAARPLSLALYKGLGHSVVEQRVQEILTEGVVGRLVVGYGANSAIAKPESIEPAIERLYEQNGQDSFISVRVDEGKHTWGDQLTLLVKLYMRALVEQP